MATHLALLQEKAEGPLVVRSVKTVSPGKNQIQVRVQAVGLNVCIYRFHEFTARSLSRLTLGNIDLDNRPIAVRTLVCHGPFPGQISLYWRW